MVAILFFCLLWFCPHLGDDIINIWCHFTWSQVPISRLISHFALDSQSVKSSSNSDKTQIQLNTIPLFNFYFVNSTSLNIFTLASWYVYLLFILYQATLSSDMPDYVPKKKDGVCMSIHRSLSHWFYFHNSLSHNIGSIRAE